MTPRRVYTPDEPIRRRCRNVSDYPTRTVIRRALRPSEPYAELAAFFATLGTQ